MNLEEFLQTKEDYKNALIGTIFADGYIEAKRTNGDNCNSYLEITHTSKNLDYLLFKKQLIENFTGKEVSISQHNKKNNTKEYSLFRLTTKKHEWFTELREAIYDNTKKPRIKLFKKEYIDKINELGLLLLYLDDGTLKMRYYPGTSKIRECRVTFCLDSFTFNELKYFQQKLFEKYGIKSRMYRHTKSEDLSRGFRIWMNTENTNKFMCVINKFYDLIPSMKYKFVKYYSL